MHLAHPTHGCILVLRPSATDSWLTQVQLQPSMHTAWVGETQLVLSFFCILPIYMLHGWVAGPRYNLVHRGHARPLRVRCRFRHRHRGAA